MKKHILILLVIFFILLFLLVYFFVEYIRRNSTSLEQHHTYHPVKEISSPQTSCSIFRNFILLACSVIILLLVLWWIKTSSSFNFSSLDVEEISSFETPLPTPPDKNINLFDLNVENFPTF